MNWLKYILALLLFGTPLYAQTSKVPQPCVDSSGSATAQTCTTTLTIGPVKGDALIFTPGTTNSGDLTLNVDGKGAAHVEKWVGNSLVVLAGGDSPSGKPYLIIFDGTFWQSNSPSNSGTGLPATPTTPNGVPQDVICTPSSGTCTAAFTLPGVTTREISGSTSTDTVVTADCGPKRLLYDGSAAVALALPTATTLAVANCAFKITNVTTGSQTAVTVTPATWTVNGLSTLVIGQNSQCTFYVNPSGTDWGADCAKIPLGSAIRSTGLTGSVSTATLCAATAGACNQSGTYNVHFAIYQSGTACTSNATGGVLVTITWTDGNAQAHSAQTVPIITNASLTAFATNGIMLWGASALGPWASGDLNIDTNGTIIQYATTFTQCSVSGTATYALSAVVSRLQ